MAKRQPAEPSVAVVIPSENGNTAVMDGSPQEETVIVGRPVRITRTQEQNDSRPQKIAIPGDPPAVVLMDQFAMAGDPTVQFVLRRVMPDYEELGNLPLMTFGNARGHVRLTHGNGEYTIQMRRKGVDLPIETGIVRFNIDDAPKEPSADDTVKHQTARRKFVEEKKKEVDARIDLEKSQAELDEIKNRKENPTVSILQQQIAELRMELKSRKEEPRKSVVETLVEFSPLIDAIGKLGLFQKAPPDTSMAEAVKEIARAQERTAERLQQSQEKMFDKIERMIEKTSKGDGSQTLKDYLMIEDRVEKRMEAMMERLTPPPVEVNDDIDIDPERPVASVIASALKIGLKGLMSLAKDPSIAKTLGELAAGIGKKPEQLVESDVPALEQEIAAIQSQRPTPAQRKLLPPLDATRATMRQSAAPAQPINPTLATAVPQTPILNLEIDGNVQSVPAAALPPQTVSEQTPPEKSDELKAKLEDDLIAEINQSVEDMILDISSGRTYRGQHVWCENAVELWNKDYLDSLETIPGSVERMRNVKSRANPVNWNKLDEVIAAESAKNGEAVYTNFFASFDALVVLWKQRKATP